VPEADDCTIRCGTRRSSSDSPGSSTRTKKIGQIYPI